MAEPRTLFATTLRGDTVLVRRSDAPDGPPSHELYVYRGYLTPSPRKLPRSIPKSYASREEALERACRRWALKPESFRDVRLGRRLDFDFMQALRQGTLEPIQPGSSAETLVAVLGMPECVTLAGELGVCWFYGSVMLHLRDGALQLLEIDRGEGDFTSLHFAGWFLERSTTKTQLERALKAHAVTYVDETVLGVQVIRTPGSQQQRGFMFDFDEKDGRIHALYWGV